MDRGVTRVEIGEGNTFREHVTVHRSNKLEEDTIIDIPPGTLIVSEVPEVPEGHEISRVEVIVRLKRLDDAQEGAERRRPLATFRRSLQRDLPKPTS